MSKLFRRVLICVFCVLGAVASGYAAEPMRLDPHETELVIARDGAAGPIAQYEIEIAANGNDRSRGLMYRTDLPLDRAMLFIFDDDAMRFFWMANTPTPLDIIFADSNGVITHIARHTTPLSRAPISSQRPARYALEVHAGQAGDFDIQIGDRMEHPVIEPQKRSD